MFSSTQNIFRLIDLNFHGCVERTLEWALPQFVEFQNQNRTEFVLILMVELKVIKLSQCTITSQSHFKVSWHLTLNQWIKSKCWLVRSNYGH